MISLSNCKEIKVIIDLNLKKNQLSYIVNDENIGIAYKNIQKSNDIKYCLAVSLIGTNANVLIEDFRIIYD